MEISLFPLRTVLFPDGPLPLRIFEQRYLDMISRCMKADVPFGVVLIRDGTETGPVEVCDVGTLARISDWYQGSDGLLGVTAMGQQRFRINASRRQADGLLMGEIKLLPKEPDTALPEVYQPLAEILEGVLDDLGRLYESLPRRYDDAGWVSYRFAEILPIPPEQKQLLLESENPLERLAELRQVLETVKSR
ncbi:MAG: LON peptidase substrate-binding domain-containing protein [Woeseiaceae bacterium]